MGRPPCCDKLNYRKRGWRDEEDAKNLQYVSQKHGTANGISVPRKPESSSSGTKRCGKSCREKLSNESFNPQEEELIIKLHAAVGSRWAIIAHQLPGRSDNDIKIHWNTKLRKKLTERGIDPVTHKPFSQILSDYGKIGGLSRATGGSRYIGTIKKDLKKVTSFSLPKPEPSSSYNFISASQEFPNFSHDNHNNNENISSTNSHSLDLLSQLQAISLVTEGTNSDTSYPHFESNQLPFGNSSLDFSSGYNNAGKVVQSPESCSWHDFLLDEAVRPVQDQEQVQEFNDLGCIIATSQSQMKETGNGDINGYQFQGGSSSSISSQASSFLEAMLDQENDMFLNFPGLMEEPLY